MLLVKELKLNKVVLELDSAGVVSKLRSTEVD
jgi:hypothetical protein